MPLIGHLTGFSAWVTHGVQHSPPFSMLHANGHIKNTWVQKALVTRNSIWNLTAICHISMADYLWSGALNVAPLLS